MPRRHHYRRPGKDPADLDMTTFLNLMVALIPFLLVTAVFSRITVVDLTKVKSEDSLNHGKFAESPAIVQLIGQRLVTGQTLTDSTIGVGDGITAIVAGTVNTVGKVAATTVATPVDLVSGNIKTPPKKKPASTSKPAPSTA